MAIARDTTAANIKPLEGALVDRFTAGSAIAAGELVVMSSDGYIDPSDSTAAKSIVLGVAVQAAAAAAERIDVVTHGRIKCLTGATPGAVVYNSTTAGEPSESVAGNQTAAGIAVSATILFVRPGY
jgi:hypothetical protein